MELGAFSISLAVKDIEKSKDFYTKLGFRVFAGDPSENWLIMRNGDNTIGLFQDIFDGNILTFNPGWDKDCNELESFADVRELYEKFKTADMEISSEGMVNETGPSSFSVIDPDGNVILIDQHI